MKNIMIVLMFNCFIIIIGCSSAKNPVNAQVELEVAFPALNFNRPVDFQFPNDNSNRCESNPGRFKL